ncbi:TetR/AcrR family transcriptional regulator [Epilithonimonas hungarica]|uniref:Transcriptional regulator, TetR family n=1 Tax=Epilithonimonas hungarica TaxID=454006 RepID=A0A1G7S460_9FLAO|nr:TetR/AcrR family transcriptional regulator [Epilithonimonas hungarica]SDG17773.1 transcriptional regulator, TetR family [Epilithonimonas hungarica]
MTKAERTRQFIIEKSAPLFNIKGYESTSLSDIQEATKLTKGAIYGNFSDKNELAIAAYNFNCSYAIGLINKAVAKAATAREALIAYPNYYAKNWQTVFKTGGCPLMNAAVEADDHLHYLRDSVRNGMKRFMETLQLTIERGQANNEFKAKANSEEYAALIYSIMEGNIMLAKIMNDPKYFQIAARHIESIIERELSV